MSNTQQISQKVQDQTLEVVRRAQDAVVEAFTVWTETANKVTAQLPGIAKGYEFAGLAEFAKLFPTAGQAIDSNFDFAQRILTTQRDFAHRIVEAATCNVVESEATAPKATALKAIERKVSAPKPVEFKATAPKTVAPEVTTPAVVQPSETTPKTVQPKANAPAKKSTAAKTTAANKQAPAVRPSDPEAK